MAKKMKALSEPDRPVSVGDNQGNSDAPREAHEEGQSPPWDVRLARLVRQERARRQQVLENRRAAERRRVIGLAAAG